MSEKTILPVAKLTSKMGQCINKKTKILLDYFIHFPLPSSPWNQINFKYFLLNYIKALSQKIRQS